MDINTINRIVWWIPFKQLRNDVRDIMINIIEIRNGIKNITEIRDCMNNITEIKDYVKKNEKLDSVRAFVNQFRENMINDKFFLNKYRNLIFNLDKESSDTVSNIISKLSNFNHIEEDIYFSDDEMKAIKDVEKYMLEHIIKINNNCYIFDNKYILNIEHFETFTFYPKHQLGISYLKNQNSIKEKDIIDAGAWIGDTAIFLSYYTKNKVYAFEPLYRNYIEMKKNIELNDINNIQPINMALGEENKKIYLEDIDATGMIGINTNLEKDNDKIEVEMITLDKFVENNNLKIGFIKIDLEGFEQPFLRGALNTIKKQKPALMISIYHNYSDFFDIKPMLENLNLGYKFKIVKAENRHSLGDTIMIAEVY